jgi:Domain of unknown function (DUF4037)
VTDAPSAPGVEPAADGPGIRLASAFFSEVIEPIVAAAAPAMRFGAALIGPGSEVAGFDDHISTDHDFGPRVQLFLRPDEPLRDRLAEAIDANLPTTFRGMPTRFELTHFPTVVPTHHVVLTTVGSWSSTELGFDVASGPPSVENWLGVPWQLLASATRGRVFRDDLGELAGMRAMLSWYPVDVWRYVLAMQWQRISQEEHLVGRAGDVGDELGAQVLAARLVRDVMHLALLQARRYPPYGKWLGTAFMRLRSAVGLSPLLHQALTATDRHIRGRALVLAYQQLGLAQNALELSAAVDARGRRFHDRSYLVIAAERFTAALLDAIVDPSVRNLPAVGSIDQFVDATDVLSRADRSRRALRAVLTVDD